MPYKFLRVSEDGNVGIVTLNGAHKRNALDEAAIAELDAYFSNVKPNLRAILLNAAGDHFCAGLDLKEHYEKARSGVEFMRVCQGWHRAFDKIQHGGIPVVACLKGAVVGGGLELASAAHVRVADSNAFFSLPEGTHGIFTGGGATVRTARIISAPRMVEMMLTGRVIKGEEALQLGLAHYMCDSSNGQPKADELAMTLAKKIAQNAELSNYAIVSAISRIADMSATDGLFAEGLVMAMVQQGKDVQSRLANFVHKKRGQ